MTDLIPIEPKNALAVFTEPEQLQAILDSIAAEVRQEVLDTSTAKGRKEIASLAFKVAKSKAYLDGEGIVAASTGQRWPPSWPPCLVSASSRPRI